MSDIYHYALSLGGSTTAAAILTILFVLFRRLNHTRCASKCCGRTYVGQVDIGPSRDLAVQTAAAARAAVPPASVTSRAPSSDVFFPDPEHPVAVKDVEAAMATEGAAAAAAAASADTDETTIANELQVRTPLKCSNCEGVKDNVVPIPYFYY